ncbi:MAG: DUF4019 domain-containing protein [Burkholderiales bacterium]
MKLPRLLVIGAAAFLPALAACVQAQSMSPEQRAALDAAERWLVPVDAGRYADAYAMASDEFRKGVTREQWLAGIGGIRRDFGKLDKRTAEKMGFLGEPPKPDVALAPGAKVVILFSGTFARKREAEEEMTMVYEKDGVWRMASYYIR